MRIAILSSIWPTTVEILQQKHECTVRYNPDDDEKRSVLSTAEVVILRSPVTLEEAVLVAAPYLNLIIRAGSGLDSIDIEAAKRQSIQVVSLPLSADSVAEHTVGLMLALARKIPRLDRSLRAGKWEKHSGNGMELKEKTLGLLGFGRIGQRTGELGRAFGMQILVFDRSPEQTWKQAHAQTIGANFVELKELFIHSDIVTVQTPLNDGTRGLIDEKLIHVMKPTSLLINVGRGGIIDEGALYECLRQKRISGAALDVFETEPQLDSKLFELENFIGTPHVAAQTDDAQRRVGEDILKVIGEFEKKATSDRSIRD